MPPRRTSLSSSGLVTALAETCSGDRSCSQPDCTDSPVAPTPITPGCAVSSPWGQLRAWRGSQIVIIPLVRILVAQLVEFVGGGQQIGGQAGRLRAEMDTVAGVATARGTGIVPIYPGGY